MDKKLSGELLLQWLSVGIVLGWVDIVYGSCGETTSHQCNTDGNEAYPWPPYDNRNEV